MKLFYAEVQEAAFEIYKETGCGFLEAVCLECLENEFLLLGIPFSSRKRNG